ncbi:MAG: hypothetical protein ABL952_07805 [Pyrinomonadaceae bacterium]
MTGFFKNEDCPSSNELLEYQNGDLPRLRGSEIGRHLGSCDFCEAEVEFYSTYPQGRDETNADEIAEIPAPLFELAEALLKNRHGDTGSLNSLLKEKTDLILDKA